MQNRIQIDVTWRPRKSWRAVSLLNRVAAFAAAAEGFHAGRLSIAVVGAAAMRSLHQRYLQMAEPTDVLTFDLGTSRRRGELDAEIVICADVALQRSRIVANQTRNTSGPRAPGKPFPNRRWLAAARAELALYLTHGLLHLAGYDDHRPAQSRRMHAREDELLERLGIGPVYQRKP
jgi:probable rRNA maturation factor